jgi:hypothetical protein
VCAHIQADDLDNRIMKELRAFPEHIALRVTKDFSHLDKNNNDIRSVSGFLMGIVKKHAMLATPGPGPGAGAGAGAKRKEGDFYSSSSFGGGNMNMPSQHHHQHHHQQQQSFQPHSVEDRYHEGRASGRDSGGGGGQVGAELRRTRHVPLRD